MHRMVVMMQWGEKSGLWKPTIAVLAVALREKKRSCARHRPVLLCRLLRSLTLPFLQPSAQHHLKPPTSAANNFSCRPFDSQAPAVSISTNVVCNKNQQQRQDLKNSNWREQHQSAPKTAIPTSNSNCHHHKQPLPTTAITANND